MPYKFQFLDEAKLEYEGIIQYLIDASEGIQAAQSFIDEFNKQVQLIRENPKLFNLSRLPDLAALNYRSMFINNYVVLYFFRDETIFIAHLFHQRQDYARFV